MRKEIEFLERGIQRVRTKLKTLKQDPTLTPSMHMIGLRPKQLGEQQDYHEIEWGRDDIIYENDLCIDPYTTIEQQIRVVVILSRQSYEEEQIQFKKQLNQIESDKSNKYYC